MRITSITVIACLFLSACGNANDATVDESANLEGLSIATFAGGCFWCMEPPFEKLDGVHAVISGYAGGEEESPTYEQVASGETRHREAVQVYFDPTVVNYRELLDVFWRQIDPTDDGGQFVDRGFQYTSAIFYHDGDQQTAAVMSKERLEQQGVFDEPIVTPVIPFTTFYEAEDYHQDYYKQKPLRYKYYRNGSGRDDFLDSVWGEGNH